MKKQPLTASPGFSVKLLLCELTKVQPLDLESKPKRAWNTSVIKPAQQVLY